MRNGTSVPAQSASDSGWILLAVAGAPDCDGLIAIRNVSWYSAKARILVPVKAIELRNWLRHAFAVETAENFAPTDAERELIQRVATEIARRGMTLPAVVMLESSRPLSGLGGQAMRFVEPWFAAVTNAAGLKVLADLLERPGGMDFVISTMQAANEACEPVAGGDRA